MHIGGRAALEAARRQAGRVAPGVRGVFSAPRVRGVFSASHLRMASGIAVITPVILAGAVAGSAQPNTTDS